MRDLKMMNRYFSTLNVHLSVPCLLMVTLIFGLTGCGGGGAPSPTVPDTQPRSGSSTSQGEKRTAQSAQPKIERGAKELFLQAGRSASQSPPNYDEAIRLYDEAYQRDKNLKLALYNIGLSYELKGDQDQARRFYELAGKQGVGDGWVNLGLMALAQGDQGQAEGLFNRALSVEPLNGRAHLNIAVFAKERKDYDTARASVRNALKEDSTNADAYDILAQIYYDLGRYKLAALVADAGLQDLDQEHAGLWTTQGLILLKLDDVIKAVRSFQRAVELDANNFAARLNLGLITFNYRDYEQSYQLLSEAVKLKPNHVEALLSLAVAARTNKRLDEARQGYEKVLSLSANHPGALFNLAVLDQDYVEVDPSDYTRRIKITQQALQQYEKVLGMSQDEKLRKKVQDRIEEAKIILEAIEVEREAAAVESATGQSEGEQAPPE